MATGGHYEMVVHMLSITIYWDVIILGFDLFYLSGCSQVHKVRGKSPDPFGCPKASQLWLEVCLLLGSILANFAGEGDFTGETNQVVT